MDVLEQLGLETLWFVPAALPPLKGRSLSASVEDRLAMIRLAIGDDPRLRICDLEIQRGGTSYTFDTLSELRRLDPESTPIWIIGEDNLSTLPHWHRIGEIAQLAEFACLRRRGDRRKPAGGLPPGLRLHHVHTRIVEISSTEIRDRVRAGKSVRYFLPDQVITHIKERTLYQHA